MDDASLTDFLEEAGAGDDEPGGETPSGEAADDAEARQEAGGDDGASGVDEGETAATTYAWTPDGAPCDACGESAARRWRDEGRLVCPDCKSW